MPDPTIADPIAPSSTSLYSTLYGSESTTGSGKTIIPLRIKPALFLRSLTVIRVYFCPMNSWSVPAPAMIFGTR